MYNAQLLSEIIEEIVNTRSPAAGANLLGQLLLGMFEGAFEKQDISKKMIDEINKSNSSESSGIWIILKYINEELWDSLSESQKANVVKYLSKNFGHFSEWVATMIASETLSAHLPSDQALQYYGQLTKAIKQVPPPSNSFIPYGIWRVVDSLDRNEVGNRDKTIEDALALLCQLLMINDGGVQKEAKLAVTNISRSIGSTAEQTPRSEEILGYALKLLAKYDPGGALLKEAQKEVRRRQK